MLSKPGGTEEADKAPSLTDVGKFRVGSHLGDERAGFSGRPKLQVFTTTADPELAVIAACLQSAEVESELHFFTPILVDGAQEPEVEKLLRQRDNLRVIVRALHGGFLGGLPAGFTCADLVHLLKLIQAHSNGPPEKSPIYALLVAEPEAIDGYLDAGEKDRALRFVELLREFEGEDSPAVAAVEARLER